MPKCLNTDAELVCTHQEGKVQKGPGATWFLINRKPALRVADVLHRPVRGCKYCQFVKSVLFGAEDCLILEEGEADGRILTEMACGLTNGGTWRVATSPQWSVRVAAAGTPRPHQRPTATPTSTSSATLRVAGMSGPVLLEEWTHYHSPTSEPGNSRPDPYPIEASCSRTLSLRPLAGKWVYVFAVDGRGKRQFVGEYWTPAFGQVRRVKTKFRANALPPDPDLDIAQELRLPIDKGQASKRYAFLASRVRLTKRNVELCGACPEVPVHAIGPEMCTVEATDPLTVAEHMAQNYSHFRDLYIMAKTGLSEDGSAISRTGCKVILAQTLLELLKQDDELDIADDLVENGAPIRQVLAQHESHVANLTAASEHAAEQLVRWLQSDLWRRTVAAYATFRASDFGELLRVFSRCADRLLETRAGQEYADRILAPKSGHFVHEFVSRTGPAPEDLFQVVRKTPEAVEPIWKLGMRWADKATFKPAALVRSLEYVFRVERVVEDLPTWTVRLRLVVEKQVTFEYIDMVEEPHRLKRAMRTLNNNELAESVIKGFKGLFEVVNFGLALQKGLGPGDKGRIERVAEITGATADALKEFYGQAADKLARQGPRLLRSLPPHRILVGLGTLAAICDIVGGYFGARSALALNDPNAAWGYTLYPAGSVLLLLGQIARLRGGKLLRVRFGYWSLLGALVAIAGIVAYTVLQKSELERFARGCEWGPACGTKNGRPIWSAAKYAEWPRRFELQLDALYRILGAFRVTADDFHKLHVQLGLVLPGSRVEVVCEYKDASERVRRLGYVYDLGERRAGHLSGWEGSDVALVELDKTGRVLIVEVPGAAPKKTVLHYRSIPYEGVKPTYVDAWVRVDLFGDNSFCLPGNNAWVSVHGGSRSSSLIVHRCGA